VTVLNDGPCTLLYCSFALLDTMMYPHFATVMYLPTKCLCNTATDVLRTHLPISSAVLAHIWQTYF